MKAVQLHDKETEEIIGTILVTDKNSYDEICEAWDEFQEVGLGGTYQYDIWNFVNYFPSMDMEVLDIDFYQP